LTSAERHTHILKTKAIELGFFACNVSVAQRLDTEATLLEKWLAKDYNGSMQWMENHFEKRVDPRKLVEGAKSVVSLGFNYYPSQEQPEGFPKIARYAYGRDYHKVIKKKLHTLLNYLSEEVGEINGRAFVDSGPVMERQWAERSGLGWRGKNSLLLTKGRGSYFFLSELILDLPLVSDVPVGDHCGTCTACIDACPTQAIIAPQVIDSNKCISHATIELKTSIPDHFKNSMEGWAFGCDICQEVCPWNRFSKPHSETDFKPPSDRLEISASDWEEMTEEVFSVHFNGTPVRRAGLDKMKDNVKLFGQ